MNGLVNCFQESDKENLFEVIEDMAVLSKNDMTKDSGQGYYAGFSRVDIMSEKIIDGRDFIIGGTKAGKKVKGASYDSKTETLTYYTDTTKKKTATTTRSKIFKDRDFGGGSGSGGGAEETKITESLQCFYCAYAFKYGQIKKPLTPKQLETVKDKCYTTHSLEYCIEKGPVDWVESSVYVKTANALQKEFGAKFGRTATFHRAGGGGGMTTNGSGSKFMDNIYKAKATCQKIDKESGDPQAPGTFSNDKWNPGDIWMTSLQSPASQKPFENFTSSWGMLKNEVQRLADTGKVLGVSLKKLKNARVHHFNKNDVLKEFQYKGFTFGKTGDFFSSNDVYVQTSDKEIQFRTFNETKAWQGEIKGETAAGGKIGGGNINFYLNEVFNKTIFRNTEDEVLAETRNPHTFIQTFYDLYVKYNPAQSIVIPTLSLEEFTTKVNEKKSETFNMSKMMCLKFLDAFLSTNAHKRDHFITELYRYAASNTEQSSYYVKIAD